MAASLWLLAVAALFLPLVIALVVYDIRWIYLSLRARQLPPWGAFCRLFAAACCHGGAILLLKFTGVWPEKVMTFWMHMTFDPGLTFYALGLWDLFNRVAKGKKPQRA